MLFYGFKFSPQTHKLIIKYNNVYIVTLDHHILKEDIVYEATFSKS